MIHGRNPVLVVLCAVLVTAGGCAQDSGGAAAGVQAAVPVVVAAVRQEDVPVQVRAVGTVEASATVAVRPQVDGQLARVHFTEGARVRRGDLLFTIDPRPFEAALRQAEGSLARTEAEANNARVEFERRERLFLEGFISRNEYEQAETRATALRAAVQAERAQVEHARLQLQYCEIRSPIDGRIGQLLVHAGNVVRRNDTVLAVINQVRPVFVSFAVPEHALAAIRQGAAAGPLPVAASANGAAPVTGELVFVDNTVDVATGTVRLKARYANDDEVLWPGQFVQVTLTVATEAGALVVPAAAVQTGQRGPFVYVVDAGRVATVRPVEVGMTVGEEVVIRDGLRAGEVVVVEGQIRLVDGSRVEVTAEWGTPAAREVRS